MKKNKAFADILTTVTKYFFVLVAVVIVFILLSGVRIVKSGEVALVLRFGKLVGSSYEEQIHKPGLLFAFPYIIDEVIIVPTGNVIEQSVTTHYTDGEMTSLRNNGYVITGDQNIAIMSASVKYVISDPVSYALNINSIDKIINSFVSSAMTECAASISVDVLLTTGKDAFSHDVMRLAQQKLSAASTGVTLGTVELTNVSMPSEVREIYDMVNSATIGANTLIEEAIRYRENLIPQAEADAYKKITDATAAKTSAIVAANADLAEFWGEQNAYVTYGLDMNIIKTRLYTQKVSEAVGKIGTVRAVQDGETKIIIN